MNREFIKNTLDFPKITRGPKFFANCPKNKEMFIHLKNLHVFDSIYDTHTIILGQISVSLVEQNCRILTGWYWLRTTLREFSRLPRGPKFP